MVNCYKTFRICDKVTNSKGYTALTCKDTICKKAHQVARRELVLSDTPVIGFSPHFFVGGGPVRTLLCLRLMGIWGSDDAYQRREAPRHAAIDHTDDRSREKEKIYMNDWSELGPRHEPQKKGKKGSRGKSRDFGITRGPSINPLVRTDTQLGRHTAQTVCLHMREYECVHTRRISLSPFSRIRSESSKFFLEWQPNAKVKLSFSRTLLITIQRSMVTIVLEKVTVYRAVCTVQTSVTIIPPAAKGGGSQSYWFFAKWSAPVNVLNCAKYDLQMRTKVIHLILSF